MIEASRSLIAQHGRSCPYVTTITRRRHHAFAMPEAFGATHATGEQSRRPIGQDQSETGSLPVPGRRPTPSRIGSVRNRQKQTQ